MATKGSYGIDVRADRVRELGEDVVLERLRTALGKAVERFGETPDWDTEVIERRKGGGLCLWVRTKGRQ